MSNINECPALRFIFFRADKWPTPQQPLAPWQAGSGKFVELVPVKAMPNGGFAPTLQQRGWYPALTSLPGDLYCVGYTVDEDGIASITVHKSVGRSLARAVIAQKHAAGKTFEIVTVPHRLEESIILGAKYFLLTRERP